MPQVLCCLLAATVLGAVAAAADDTDKSVFTLFNPTPLDHLRELSVDGGIHLRPSAALETPAEYPEQSPHLCSTVVVSRPLLFRQDLPNRA